MASKKPRPFMGVDGEGCGQNKQGQQHYKLLGASGGIKPLYTGKHLSTFECLDWLCDLPPEPLLVGFSFGYDATQILRDLPAERLTRLFADKDAGQGHSRYTWWRDYAIEYLPKNYLRVCRTRSARIMADGRFFNTRQRIEGSTRTVYETFGFFQQSFLAALRAFDIGKAHWEMIERNKSARAEFTRITQEIREYNRLECELLAALMEEFRQVCHAAGLRPKTWNGAGKLSAFLHDQHKTVTAAEIADLVPPPVLGLAADAYYGGRFEVTRVGEIAGPVYEADIGSAYPAAMRRLPCLLHGTWEQMTSGDGGKPDGLYVAYVTFSHPPDVALCGLPVRQRDGRLFWPREGQGVYWSPEIRSAQRLGAKVRHTLGWRYVCNCECRPFAWVKPLFEERRALGKDRRGAPIKLGLSSLYGKLAQRIGAPRWGNFIWAGLITAMTRAKLNHAARQAPTDVVMFATDAIFSKSPLRLRTGTGLGQWEVKQHAGLFIVQPGIYFGASRPKTRGVPTSLFSQHVATFEKDWRHWCLTAGQAGAGPPIVSIPLPLFTGLRLAHARGKPETAGRWSKDKRDFSFDWSGKRGAEPLWEGRTCVRTLPADGAPDLVSVPHTKNLAWSTLNEERMVFDDQPDHVDYLDR